MRLAEIERQQLAAAELSDRQLLCMALRFFEGRTQQEIAERLGTSQPAIYYHIAAGRRRLARAGLTIARSSGAHTRRRAVVLDPAILDELPPWEIKGRW